MQLLPRTYAHPWRARAAYALITFGPICVSLSMLAGLGWRAGLIWAALGLGALRQVNIGIISLLYHRSASHRAFRVAPALAYPARVWGWIFTGAGTRTWALIHRWHHAAADTADDPHSPNKPGEALHTISRQSLGVFLRVPHDDAFLAKYDKGLANDGLERLIRWDERRLYGTYGLRVPLLVTALTVPFALAAGPWAGLLAGLACLPGAQGSHLAGTILLINGVAHHWGYRQFDTRDQSTNIVKRDLFGFGEALHHNHHAQPSAARFDVQPDELDAGWWVIAALERVGLVTAVVRAGR